MNCNLQCFNRYLLLVCGSHPYAYQKLTATSNWYQFISFILLGLPNLEHFPYFRRIQKCIQELSNLLRILISTFFFVSIYILLFQLKIKENVNKTIRVISFRCFYSICFTAYLVFSTCKTR